MVPSDEESSADCAGADCADRPYAEPPARERCKSDPRTQGATRRLDKKFEKAVSAVVDELTRVARPMALRPFRGDTTISDYAKRIGDPLRESKLLRNVWQPAARNAGLGRVTWHQFHHFIRLCSTT
jgi:hypothetical protein